MKNKNRVCREEMQKFAPNSIWTLKIIARIVERMEFQLFCLLKLPIKRAILSARCSWSRHVADGKLCKFPSNSHLVEKFKSTSKLEQWGQERHLKCNSNRGYKFVWIAIEEKFITIFPLKNNKKFMKFHFKPLAKFPQTPPRPRTIDKVHVRDRLQIAFTTRAFNLTIANDFLSIVFSELFSASSTAKARPERQWNPQASTRHSKLREPCGVGRLTKWWVFFFFC